MKAVTLDTRQHRRCTRERARAVLACCLLLGALLAGAAAPAAVRAQSGTCDIVVPAATTVVDGVALGAQPGDTVCLQAGATPRPSLRLRNFTGTAENPIYITNTGGRVVIGPATPQDPILSTHNGLLVTNSQHFVLSGRGDPAHPYGIHVSGTRSGVSGVSLGGKSEYFRVEALEVSRTGFAGIMSKSDPACDLSVNRGVWTQRQTYFSGNYIHDVGGEGFYVGHTFYAGYQADCDGDGTKEALLYPHEIHGVHIVGNRVERAGWDGIQLSSATQDAVVAANTVVDFGVEGRWAQQQGIQIGSGTVGWVTGNLVRDGTGNAIEMHGYGDNVVTNNLLIRPDGAGVYIGNWDATPGRGFFFFNNTIVGSGSAGISMNSQQSTGSAAYNNIIVDPGRVSPNAPYIAVSSGADWTAAHNVTGTAAALRFVDAAADDYRLQATSPAVDAGRPLAQVPTDFSGAARPQGSAYDAGAYEVQRVSPVLFQQSFESSAAVGDYVHLTSPSGGQFNDISSEPAGGTWSIAQGRLQLARPGGTSASSGAGITRHTGFAGPPALLSFAFDLGVANWTLSPSQSGAMVLAIGNFTGVTDYNNGEVAASVFQSLSVKGEGAGRFSVTAAGVRSATLAADGALHRVVLLLNKSPAPVSYRAPDGRQRVLRGGDFALWVDSALVVEARAANGSSSALTDMRLRFSAPNDGRWSLDNLVVHNALPR